MKWSNIFSIKYFLGAINVVFALTGVVLLSVGLAVLLFFNEYDKLLSARFYSLPQFLIATAVLIFLTTPLGVYGALTEDFHYILAYTVLTLIVLVFELSACIAGYALRDGTAAEVKRALQLSMLQYGGRVELTAMWDELQADFECCGANGPSDWQNMIGGLPVSCCHLDYGLISPLECVIGAPTLNLAGCADLLGDWIAQQAFNLAVSGLALCCLQTVLTAGSGWLAWRSRFEEVELES